jgi:hypothetical protein
MIRWLAIAVLAIVSMTSAAVNAQELATDAERSYRDLRKSHDTKSRLLAERWYGAVKLQEWTDATGRFKTTAKYLEHDPDLAWVKLRVIEGSGDQRVVKEVIIPLEKLSKICQARVRRIGGLSEKVAAAIAEATDLESEKDEGHAGEMPVDRTNADEQRDGGRAAGRAGMDAEAALAEGGRTRRSRPVPTAANREPLPALLPPLPAGAAGFGQVASTPKVPQAVPAERRER